MPEVLNRPGETSADLPPKNHDSEAHARCEDAYFELHHDEFVLDYAASAQFVRGGDLGPLLDRVRRHALRRAAETIAELGSRRR